MVETVVFDIGGVLVDIDYLRFLNNLSNELNIPITVFINNSIEGIHYEYMRGLITSEQYVEQICKKYNFSISIERFRGIWDSILLRQNDDVAEIVNNLYNHYQLAILSNIDPWHFAYCNKNYSVFKMFKKIFLSYEHHFLKPDPQFFKFVADQLNVQPTQCLLIDDTLENIQEAEKVGFQVIQFKDVFRLQNDLTTLGIMNLS